MSKYTTEVRFICEHEAGLVDSEGYNSVNQILQDAHSKIFDFEYPIFDEEYRSVLEIKILKHFYTREICAETVGLWKLWLDARMNEIMPYYNKLYASELIEFNPMYDTDYTRTMDRDGTETGTSGKTGNVTHSGTITDQGTSGNTRTNNLNKQVTDGGEDTKTTTTAEKNDHWDYYSDTPQGTVDDLADLRYLTNARHITDDGTGSSGTENIEFGKTETTTNTGTVTDSGTTGNTRTLNHGDNSSETRTKNFATTDDYIEHVIGKMPGSNMSVLLKDFRSTFLNIDMMIIKELEDLFFALW